MILNQRGQPARSPREGFGFWPTAPVLPRRRPAKAEGEQLETTAIGFAIAHADEEEAPPEDE